MAKIAAIYKWMARIFMAIFVISYIATLDRLAWHIYEGHTLTSDESFAISAMIAAIVPFALLVSYLTMKTCWSKKRL